MTRPFCDFLCFYGDFYGGNDAPHPTDTHESLLCHGSVSIQVFAFLMHVMTGFFYSSSHAAFLREDLTLLHSTEKRLYRRAPLAPFFFLLFPQILSHAYYYPCCVNEGGGAWLHIYICKKVGFDCWDIQRPNNNL